MCFSLDEITNSFRRFGHLVVDWPHKAESKSYFPPKGERASVRLSAFSHPTSKPTATNRWCSLGRSRVTRHAGRTLGRHGGVCLSKVTPLGRTCCPCRQVIGSQAAPGPPASELRGIMLGKAAVEKPEIPETDGNSWRSTGWRLPSRARTSWSGKTAAPFEDDEWGVHVHFTCWSTLSCWR